MFKTYFARSGRDGPVKIGKAVNIERRLAILQAGNHLELVLVAWCSVDIEAALHEEFSHLRLYRPDGKPSEFFEYAYEIDEFIKSRTVRRHRRMRRRPDGTRYSFFVRELMD